MYNFNVTVIGDYGLDIWREGSSHRLSPEAPVPVVLNPSLRKSPGLAGNVAANLTSLGAKTCCFGVVGADSQGDALFEACIRHGLSQALCSLYRHRGRLTTVKERIISDSHQIARIDEEETHPLEPRLENAIINQVAAAIAHTDGVVISDYGKGVCTELLVGKVIDIAYAKNVPVFVDPKNDLLKYSGVTILKPNEVEWDAYLVMCRDMLDLSGQICAVRADYVVVTRGADGMDILTHSAEDGSTIYRSYFPGYKVPVHDRTGAGDTAMAVMALEYIHSKDIVEAVKLANIAGALAVQHSGTYRVTVEDIEKFKRERHVGSMAIKQTKSTATKRSLYNEKV